MRAGLKQKPISHKRILVDFQRNSNKRLYIYFLCFFSEDKWCGESYHTLIYHLCILMRCLLRSLARVSVRFCFLIIEFQEFFVYFGNSLSSNVFCKHFPPVCGLSPNSFDTIFWRAKGFNFNEVQLINYFCHGSCLWCCI